MDDEDNDGEDEDEEDSQAESGVSATPSVSASPQHLPAVPLDALPSALLAQMSISAASPGPGSAPLSLPPPPTSDSQASDTESVTMMSPVSVVSPSPAYLSFPTFPVSVVSAGPAPLSFPPLTTVDSHSSDTESVTMMSPVSPCRQMSIDYPEVDSPTSPPAPGKVPKVSVLSVCVLSLPLVSMYKCISPLPLSFLLPSFLSLSACQNSISPTCLYVQVFLSSSRLSISLPLFSFTLSTLSVCSLSHTSVLFSSTIYFRFIFSAENKSYV